MKPRPLENLPEPPAAFLSQALPHCRSPGFSVTPVQAGLPLPWCLRLTAQWLHTVGLTAAHSGYAQSPAGGGGQPPAWRAQPCSLPGPGPSERRLTRARPRALVAAAPWPARHCFPRPHQLGVSVLRVALESVRAGQVHVFHSAVHLTNSLQPAACGALLAPGTRGEGDRQRSLRSQGRDKIKVR